MAKKIDLKMQEKMLLTPCKTRQEFMNWVKYHFYMHIPDTTVSRYADTNPFDAIWEVYDICVNGNNPQDIEELLFVASRGSGKTLGMAIAELAVLLHGKRDFVHVGAILSQAKRCYDYQNSFMLNDRLKPVLNNLKPDPADPTTEYRILSKNTQEMSVFNLINNRGKLDRVTMEILPCTLKAVNGPHCPLVVVDEIDTVQGDGLKAFKDISGMLDSRDGMKALRIGISTRKSRYGLMNKQIEDAEAAGRTVRKWTAFEFAERCPDERSGTKPTEFYINMDEMRSIDKEQYNRMSVQQKGEWELEQFPGEKCRNCPIAPMCRGDAKKQTSKSPMLKPITDVIKKAIENGPDWALSQLMNLKPSVEGIIYKEFNEKDHVKTWNQMWKILTNKEFPGECTQDDFIKMCHQMGMTCYAGIDWGWSNPSTVTFLFIDNRENVYVVACEGRTFTNNPTWAQTIKSKWHQKFRCQLYFPDPANPGDLVTMRQEGLPVPNDIDKDVLSGIQVVKRFLRDLASPEPKIFFAKDTCGPIIQEFQTYHYKVDAAGEVTEEPAKEFDHWLDGLRYTLYNLFGKSKLIIPGALDVEIPSITNNEGQYSRAPSPEEFAKENGLRFNNNTEEAGKIGKRGTLSELMEEDEDGIGGNGGFLWSF